LPALLCKHNPGKSAALRNFFLAICGDLPGVFADNDITMTVYVLRNKIVLT
jgi:hypothetical protein